MAVNRFSHPSRTTRRVGAGVSRLGKPGFGRLLVAQIQQSEGSRATNIRRIVLAIAICTLLGVLLPNTASTRVAPRTPPVAATVLTLDGMASEVVLLVNLERAQHKLPPLRVNTRLVVDAQLQAAQIAATGVLDHVILGGPYPTPRVRAEVAGYAWNVLGENLALGYTNATSAVAAWMRSPGHRANILAGSYSETGVVLAPDARGRLIFVQTFGAPE